MTKEIILDLDKLNTALSGQGINELTQHFQKGAHDKLLKIIARIDQQPKGKEHHFLNNIFISGGRGSGKTCFLENIENSLQENNKYLFFKTIDPTRLHDNENFLTILIAQILNYIKDEKLSEFQNSKELFNLITKLSQCIEAIVPNQKEPLSVLQMIANDQQGLNITTQLNEFLQYIIQKTNTEKLVFLIDDVDMAFEKGYEVLEVIRRYLSSKSVIIIITGDFELYRRILIKKFFYKLSNQSENNHINDSNIEIVNTTIQTLNITPSKITAKKTNLAFSEKLADDYLTKLLPCNNRIQIKNIDDYSDHLQGQNSLNGLNRIIIKKTEYNKKEKFELKIGFENFIENFHLKSEEANVILKNLPLRKLLQLLQGEFRWFFLKNLTNEERLASTFDRLQRIDLQYNLSFSNKRAYYAYFFHFNNGWQYYEKQEFEQAIKEFEQAYKETENKDHPKENILKIIRLLGRLYLETSDYSKAIDVLAKAIEMESSNFENHFNLGKAYEETNKVSLAIEEYEKAVRIKDTEYFIFFRLGILYQFQKEYTVAITHLKKSTLLNPEHAQSYYELGCTQTKLNQNKIAKENLLKAIELDDKCQEAYRELVTIFLVEKEFSKAKEKLLELLNLNPKDSPSIFNLGYIYYQRVQYDKAIEQFEKIEQQDLTYIKSLYYLGVSYYGKENYNIANIWFDKCLDNNINFYNAYFYLGKIALKKHRLETATKQLSHSLSFFLRKPTQEMEYMEYIQYKEVSFLLKKPMDLIDVFNVENSKERVYIKIIENAFNILERIPKTVKLSENLKKDIRLWEEEYAKTINKKLDFNFQLSMDWFLVEKRSKKSQEILEILKTFRNIISTPYFITK